MELSKLLLPFFLLSTIMAKQEDKCLPGGFKCAFDYSDQLIIDFPFSYEGCSYPGFNISCNEENKASIQIGTWGKFSVRGVNFFKQEVQIYDQHNCLPKRLLSLDLSGTPFTGAHYEKFTFYNCSSEFSSNVLKPISCLSTRSRTIFASSNSSTAEIFSKCDVIASVMVPSKSGSKTDISKNIHLIWDTPDCRACLRHDGQCVLKKKGSTEITCVLPSLAPTPGLSRAAKYGIAFGVGIPILIGIILIAYFHSVISKFRRRINHFKHVESSPTVTQQPIIAQ